MINPVNERFLRVVAHLLDRGIVSSQKEFAQVMGFPDTHFPGFRTGKRNVGLTLITNLHIKYGVSVYYMVIGKGPMMEEDAKRQREKEKLEQDLRHQLDLANAKIALLEREREELLKDKAFLERLVNEKLK
jgi:hypothetical protein